MLVANTLFDDPVAVTDPEVAAAMNHERVRQQSQIELIASENFVSRAVLAAQGSVLTNKYAEGYPGRRYYGGCEFVDAVETLAIERARRLSDVPLPMSSRTREPRPTRPPSWRCCSRGTRSSAWRSRREAI